MTAPDHLATADGRRIAYHRTPVRGEGGALPGVVFLGGFASDMTGTKAMHLEAWAQHMGRAFLRLDYTGHGASSGRFDEGTIGGWVRDAEDAIAALTDGPQILVGSSMGGWIALLLARRLPARIAGLVGIAAAPDFTEDGMWAAFSEAERTRLMREGRLMVPSAYDPAGYVITLRLIEEGRAHLVLRQPLPLPIPVRLLHGTADPDVPMATALHLLHHAAGPDIRLTLVKGGGHRFSEPAELAMILQAVEEVTAAA
ncbi:MAG TPA: alpha/beta fold hydrolase [Paracoccaceae bacterium]|nr:alpha/beta fold hydrolase [Paracoccaceae bacterium]